MSGRGRSLPPGDPGPPGPWATPWPCDRRAAAAKLAERPEEAVPGRGAATGVEAKRKLPPSSLQPPPAGSSAVRRSMRVRTGARRDCACVRAAPGEGRTAREAGDTVPAGLRGRCSAGAALQSSALFSESFTKGAIPSPRKILHFGSLSAFHRHRMPPVGLLSAPRAGLWKLPQSGVEIPA